jgi:hypothetical protein
MESARDCRKKQGIMKCAGVFIVAALACVPAGARAEEAGWVRLFNGINLEGWEQKNGTATYRVEDGAIVGRTTRGSPNSFLCTAREYGDFELEFEVKVDDPLNSGVQIRSRSLPEFKNGRVHGPQVEIATNGNAGFLYGEALGTGWICNEPAGAGARGCFKKGEWNRYRVVARGKSIKTSINGIPVADCADEKSGMKSGFIGLQVHWIWWWSGPFEVRWRNLRIRELGGVR